MNDDCLKLTAYFGERQRTDGRFLADAILDLYGQHNIAASIVLRAAAASGCATICAPTNSYRCLKTRLWP